jgi:hypothetical protein
MLHILIYMMKKWLRRPAAVLPEVIWLLAGTAERKYF